MPAMSCNYVDRLLVLQHISKDTIFNLYFCGKGDEGSGQLDVAGFSNSFCSFANSNFIMYRIT